MSSTPHDTLVKQIFSNKEDSISFLESTLPREVLEILDLTNLEETKESFVNQNENTNHTDILWKIPLKSGESVYVYLLLEHKSYYDPNIYLQILGYLTNIYTWQKENQKALKFYRRYCTIYLVHGKRMRKNFGMKNTTVSMD